MTIISRAEDFNTDDLFLDLGPALGAPLYLKCEGFNFAGSIKLKPAQEMVTAAEDRGLLREDSILVESSSGNLGVALSVVAASRGYRFICVTDTRCNETARLQMQAMGAEVHVISEPDPERGLVGARIGRVRALCDRDDRCVWLNQYANEANWMAHHQSTGPELAERFPDLDVVFIAAGTTGTLMGCARYLKEFRPEARIVAVDAEGSALFGATAEPRRIPGVGNSIRPALLDESFVDDVVHVSEPDTIRMCRRLAANGFVFGGSTGTVVSGALSWLRTADAGARAVAVAPDLGTHYLQTLYRPEWFEEAVPAGQAPGRNGHSHSGSVNLPL